MKLVSFVLAFSLAAGAPAYQHLVKKDQFDAIAAEYSGEAAQEIDRQIVAYHRIQGSPMMTDVAEQVVLARLRAAGIEARLEQFPSDGKTRYQTHISPMGWEMRGGELWVESVAGDSPFQPVRLCRYSDVPMCVSTYSKGGEWTGELVEVGAGTSAADYEGHEVRGKVVLASGYAANVVREAVVRRGAAGAVIYPSATDRPEHPDMVRYNGIWPRAEELEKTSGSFQISASQYAQLRNWMRRGAVRLRGKIDATLGPGQLTLVDAYIRGREEPHREVLVTAHLDHPKWSANDNASGSAAILEMARTLQALIAGRKVPRPRRTIHFMWVPEYFGTLAYVTRHAEARACRPWDDPRQASPAPPTGPCILANLNLDMVGEDTVKTNSRFYITRTPDSVPSMLDAVMADVLDQTRQANLCAPTGARHYWPAEMIPYTQGSDHDVLLGLGVPGAMLGHDPDWTHHTSEDTVDKTDASEFRRVGVLATAAALWIAGAEPPEWKRLWSRGTAAMLADRTNRIGAILAGPQTAGARKRLAVHTRQKERAESLLREELEPFLEQRGSAQEAPQTLDFAFTPLDSAGPAPRRKTLLPIDGSAFEALTGEDKKWWDEQGRRFSGEISTDALPQGANFGLLVYEAVNFMDGRRTTADIAGLLSAEYELDVDTAWVRRLIEILGKLGLVSDR